jgi:HEAT repeat protein
MSTASGGPTRFCPSCYARNAWSAAACESCGAGLQIGDDFDERLVWALRHPDTATAVRAAEALASRGTEHAIPALVETLASPEVYRAAAAAAALRVLSDNPAAAAALETARHHPSVVVRRAAERTPVGPER